MSNFNNESKRKIAKTNKRILNKYGTYITNAVVQPDSLTEMGVPIPDEDNVKQAKKFQEENEK